MSRKNTLADAPPYVVEQSLKRLGENLRTARLRRNITIKEAAEKIGTGSRAVAAAENGKPSTSAAVYMALLWIYDLLEQMRDVADPASDEEGLGLSMSRERTRARPKESLDNDF
jgi:transcriptional regulator with XRE-family HTH domain